MRARRTFWEQAIFAGFSVLAQEPAVSKVVVALNELDAVAAPETQLVGAAGDKLVYGVMSVGGSSMSGCARRQTHSTRHEGAETYGLRRVCRRGGSPRCESAGPWSGQVSRRG